MGCIGIRMRINSAHALINVLRYYNGRGLAKPKTKWSWFNSSSGCRIRDLQSVDNSSTSENRVSKYRTILFLVCSVCLYSRFLTVFIMNTTDLIFHAAPLPQKCGFFFSVDKSVINYDVACKYFSDCLYTKVTWYSDGEHGKFGHHSWREYREYLRYR